MKLSVIVPTVGRWTLERTLASCADADEIVLVVDDAVADGWEPEGLARNVVVDRVVGGDHGYTARTRGMALATGTHLAFLDDDDVYAPGAVALIRAVAGEVPIVFRMAHPEHGVLWRDPVLRFGNVGTPMFVVPNDPARLGVWAPHAPGLPEPGGDFTFLAGCCERMGAPVWREEVVAVIRPLPSVAIVTPWLNHQDLYADFNAAVSDGAPDEVLVIDNGSVPPLGFAALRLTENRGFSAACNVGLRAARTDAVVFLNNDVVMTRSGWLDRIRAALEPGVLVGACMRYDRHGDVDGHALPYLDGWCLAGMTADLRELGGFDESYAEPAYYSDNDLCLRARAAGMALREVRVGLRHLTGVTAGPADDPAKLRAVELNFPRFEARARELLGVAA